jgi:Xaa-Pro aminopeptidase
MHRRSALPILVAVVLALTAVRPSGAGAQDAPPPPPRPSEERPSETTPALAAEKAERRRRAAELAGPDAVLLVLSPPQAGGVPWSNRNADFEYLSPVEAREAAVLVAAGRRPEAGTDGGAGGAAGSATDASSGGAVDRLYVPLRSPATERWTGPEAGPGAETAHDAAFREARALEQLADDLLPLVRARSTLYVSAGPAATGGPALAKVLATVRERLPGRWIRIVDAPGGGKDDLVESIRRALPANLPDGDPAAAVAKLPATDVRSARTLLAELREVKSPAEIERIRRATDATVAGHLAAMRGARPGAWEYQVQAAMEFECRARGCRRQAYPSIVGSGPNSCVLHYDRNRRRLEAGDLVVHDAGGEFEGYACDVTRTFPVSGKFTEEQAKVYDAVLEAQEAAIAAVKPGVTLRQVHEAAVAVLQRHGLAKWFIHGTSHSVGLDVHDPWRANAVLRPGVVLTVEPGVYDPARNLGVRIEDTVVVTETGCEVLSSSLPKRRDEIERLLGDSPR